MNKKADFTGLEIAVIGMGGRFPGAATLDEYWDNLKNGVESVEFFSEEERNSILINKEILDNPAYVPSKGAVLDNKEYFDAGFFKYLPEEAELLSPQTRIFQECVWDALEDAGYSTRHYNGLIGLYAGGTNGLLWESLIHFGGAHGNVSSFFASFLSGSAYMCALTAYKMGLTGPCNYIHTACSTSLVAINNACRALLTGECQIALAGGASVSPIHTGYVYEEGMINSKDGHVHAFDSNASGIVGGEGAGVVVLKLLSKALQDGDNIHAIIKGTYTNNDGDGKVGFTAPGVNGQAKVITSAMKMAGVTADSISYVETHGTGTPLGDVTEIDALKQAFNTSKRQYCALGAVKANIGHLDTAAGIAGFLKVVLALKYRQLPPIVNFKEPNPNIDFPKSPFYINTSLKPWNNDQYPLRAGISSFGMGGTNAHVILEEAPAIGIKSPGRQEKLLLLSAKSPSALETMTKNLSQYLTNRPHLDIADVSYTLQIGREEFPYRRKVICTDTATAIAALQSDDGRRISTNRVKKAAPPIVFMFSGLGAQYRDMCKGLYENEPLFRKEMDRCFETVERVTGIALKNVIFSLDNSLNASTAPFSIYIAQLAVFVVEHALAAFLIALGIKPYALIGYSFGEYVAACMAGVFSIEDAVKIIHVRGKLMESIERGCMLSIPLSRDNVTRFLNDDLSLAIDNGTSCVVSGLENAIKQAEAICQEERLFCMRLDTDRAAHSHMMEPVREELLAFVSTIQLNAPSIPYVSNVTGNWIQAKDAVDPEYWVKQLRYTVEFDKCLDILLKEEKHVVYIELGPGTDLSTLLKRKLELNGKDNAVISLVRPAQNRIADTKYFTDRLGQLWLQGVAISWKNYYSDDRRQRVSLPSYPFERKRYWKLMDDYQAGKFNYGSAVKAEENDRLFIPTWKRGLPVSKIKDDNFLSGGILVFNDECGLGESILAQITRLNTEVVWINKGSAYQKLDDTHYQVNIEVSGDYDLLFADLKSRGYQLNRIFHLFTVTDGGRKGLDIGLLQQRQREGYYSLLNIMQSIAMQGIDEEIKLEVISNGLFEVIGGEHTCPEKATLLGPVKVIPQEFLNVQCRCIDLDLKPGLAIRQELIVALAGMLTNDAAPDNIIAIRGGHIWLPELARKPAIILKKEPRLRQQGVYLITGGLGGIALALARMLANEWKARMTLVTRSDFPEKEKWNNWLTTYGEANDTSRKIVRLQEIESLGGMVLIQRADISDREALTTVVDETEYTFGKLNGIIHTATLPDGAMIAVREHEMSEQIFRAKLYGTLLLDEIVGGSDLDFVFHFSALAAILGGVGQVGYSAANAFQDAFALYKNRTTSHFTISVNWGRWKDTGIAKIIESRHRELAGNEMLGGLDVNEALNWFKYALSYEDVSQVIVGEHNLPEQIEAERINRKAQAQYDPSLLKEQTATTKIARFDLTSEYEAPETELEEKLVHIWENFLGIDKIGVNDNFFELGGDSLKGMLLLKRIKKEQDFDMGIKIFFLKPTIRMLSAEINNTRRTVHKKERVSSIKI